MKKIKNEKKLLQLALDLGVKFARSNGYTNFEKYVTAREKVECIYKLLVQYKQITPLANDKIDGLNMQRKLVLWIMRMLPKDHPLL